MDFKELKNGKGGAAATGVHDRESERLALLASYFGTGFEPDPVLDSIARIAARMFDAPIGFLALVDDGHVRFVARHGMERLEAARESCPCDHVVRYGAELVVEDASLDPRFSAAEIVRNEPRARFVAAVPLLAPEGVVVGTLCVVDTWPRRASSSQVEQLRNLAAVAMQQLVANRQELGLRRAESELELHTRLFENSVDLNCIADREGHLLEINRRWTEVLGWDLESMRGKSYAEFVHVEDRERTAEALARLNLGHNLDGLRIRYLRRDGGYVWLEWTALAPVPGDDRLFAIARDVSTAVANEEALRLQNEMLALIGESQTRLFSGTRGRQWWNYVLDRLLALTGSEYGFIGFTGEDEQGPFLRTKAITNIAWDQATRDLYRSQESAGMVFRNMNTLFGRAITSQQRIISNDVSRDVRATGRPTGHPPLEKFAGLPIRDGSKMVGLVGLANRKGGYDDAILSTLDPVLAYLGAALASLAFEEQRAHFLSELEAAKDLQDRVFQSLEAGIVTLRDDGTVSFANDAARGLLLRLDRLFQPDARGLGAALAKLFPLEPNPRTLEALAQVDAGSPSVVLKLLVKDADGAPFRVEVTGTRLKSGNGSRGDLLLSVTDLRQRLAYEEASRDKLRLEAELAQATRIQQHNKNLSECIDLLQSSTNLSEGFEVLGRNMPRLFPSASFAVYIFDRPGGSLRLAHHLERPGTAAPLEQIVVRHCWALRSHRAYGVWRDGDRIACSHAPSEPGATELCAPLLANTREVALLTVKLTQGDAARSLVEFEALSSQFDALAQAVSGALSNIALRETLERLALTDELTELPNRRAFVQEVSRELARSRRNGLPFALCLLDIDHFKSVNDTLGHDVGDELLRRVALLMRRHLREADLCARVGGEEFAIFLADISPETTEQRMQSLLNTVRAGCFVGDRVVTASIGVAHAADVGADTSFEALYRAADRALYSAKQSGRDRMVRQRSPASPSAPAGADEPGA